MVGGDGAKMSEMFLTKEGPAGYDWADKLRESLLGYMFFTTTRGYMGVVPGGALVGDILSVVHGLDVPFVFRKRGQNSFILVGGAYVHGLIDGQAVDGELQ